MVHEEPLRLLAGAAAGALAEAADTELWPRLRVRMATVLAPQLSDVVGARMDEARQRLVAVPKVRLELARAEFTTEWRGSIHTMLWQRPEAAGPLRAVLHEVGPDLPRTPVDVAVG